MHIKAVAIVEIPVATADMANNIGDLLQWIIIPLRQHGVSSRVFCLSGHDPYRHYRY